MKVPDFTAALWRLTPADTPLLNLIGKGGDPTMAPRRRTSKMFEHHETFFDGVIEHRNITFPDGDWWDEIRGPGGVLVRWRVMDGRRLDNGTLIDSEGYWIGTDGERHESLAIGEGREYPEAVQIYGTELMAKWRRSKRRGGTPIHADPLPRALPSLMSVPAGAET